MKKLYYQCRFTQTAPLRLTSGEGEHTDSDLLLDGRGYPFIPGSALAGVLRSMCLDICGETERDALFGWLNDRRKQREPKQAQPGNREQDAQKRPERHESRLQVSDAVFRGGKADFEKSVRHGVGINEDTGTAKDGAKFDFEVVETINDCHYTAVLELYIKDEAADAALVDTVEKLLNRIVADGIRFGARTTRGYGSMRAEIFKRKFTLGKESTDNALWLGFDPFDEANFDGDPVEGKKLEDEKNITGRKDMDIHAQLQMNGSFTVRVKSTVPGGVDQYPMHTMRDEKIKVIPGTSWAGVFRHHMRSLALQAGLGKDFCKAIDDLFGKTADGVPKRSRIIFHETEIRDGRKLNVVRNALDRFTMAPRDTALFHTEVCQGGKGELRIELRDDLRKFDQRLSKEDRDKFTTQQELLEQLLYAALLDLHNGLLNVGGEGSVGRGRVKIVGLTINGEPTTELLGYTLKKEEGGAEA